MTSRNCSFHKLLSSPGFSLGGGTPRKIGWGCAARFPKPLPYLWPTSATFPTLFMTWPKIRNPIYDLSLTSKSCFEPALLLDLNVNYRKHNLWRAFVEFLFDNDENVASRPKIIPISRLECRNHTLFMTKMAKISKNRYPIYDENGWKTIPFGAAHTYIAHIRKYPLPRDFLHLTKINKPLPVSRLFISGYEGPATATISSFMDYSVITAYCSKTKITS